ncbi:MAG: cation:proton antiporter [Sphingobacteriia bacterium]|jgi:Kef-type K+ transport system membrane component KefB
MTTALLIAICILLLIAYFFDITSSKTKIPSVILLLILGYLVNFCCNYIQIAIPDLSPILPFLGTVGLILIVLEGSLELEFNKAKLPFVGKAALVALIPMLLLSFVLGYAFHYFGNISYKDGLANAIPFAIISSAIAIPSVQNQSTKHKEFITYESSLSDIFGVIFFNFITLNDNIGGSSFSEFFIEIIVILLITFIATIFLAFLLSKINHQVKYLPIIIMIILIYAASKLYHLPGLIFILLFGLFMGNLDELKHFNLIKRLKPELLNKEVHQFKDLTTEITFIVRALFFILFGFLIKPEELLNTETIIWAIAIVSGIFALRLIFLKIFQFKLTPILFVAPRGLITILLFLSIPFSQASSLANKSLIIQVILMSALIMMIGLMFVKENVLEKNDNL